MVVRLTVAEGLSKALSMTDMVQASGLCGVEVGSCAEMPVPPPLKEKFGELSAGARPLLAVLGVDCRKILVCC